MQVLEDFSGLFDFGDDCDLSEIEEDLNAPIAQSDRPYSTEETAIAPIDEEGVIDVEVYECKPITQ